MRRRKKWHSFGLARRSLPASITVEASFVMAVVLMSLAVLIRAAYGQYRKTTEVINMHNIVEQQRYREEDQSCVLSHGQVTKHAGQVNGYVRTENWEKEITTKVYEPEEFLRMLTIFEQEGRHE